MMSQPQHEKKYRRDIDALRAIAVLSVVIYHFSKDWLPGGFVGVDVFFVISGFLISSILVPAIANKSFSFADFYLRRIRRIIPATLFCVGVTVAVCSAFYTPSDGLSAAKSGLAALFSISNLYFLQGIRTDYFAPTADTLPLLHTWSLGVEEQFYLIWPLIIVILAKMKRLGWLWLVSIIFAVLSFYIGEYYLKVNPSFSYYMLPARAGELLVGGLAYLLSTRMKPLPLLAYHLASLVGLGLILYASFFFNKSMNFPGIHALIPTLGAALFILAGTNEKNRINTGIAIKPLVFIGLISFSLYLWHWPVLAFMRYAYTEIDPIQALVSVGLIFLLTIFSYYCVEKPFRNATRLKRNYGAIGTVCVVVVALCVWVIQHKGTLQPQGTQQFNGQMQVLVPNTLPANAYSFNCQMAHFDNAVYNQKRCTVGTGSRPNFIVIGDSNAAHYVGYLKKIVETRGGSFRNYTHSACAPFAENVIGTYVAANQVASCQQYNRKIREVTPQYDTVFIGGSWNNYLTLAGEEKFRQDLGNMLRAFSNAGQNLIIATKVPIFPSYDLKCQEKSIRMPFIQCGKREGYSFKVEQAANQIILELATHYSNVQVLSLRERICSNGFCSPYLNNKPLYFDANHLSMEGSILIAETDLKDHRVPAYLFQALTKP